MAIPIPITQTINAKQGIPFAYSLSGTNISNTTNWAFSTTNVGGLITFQRSKQGPNPRLIFKPLDYGSGITENSNGNFYPYVIRFYTWNATGIGEYYDQMPLSSDVVTGNIYLNILPQKPVITPGQLVTAVDGEPFYTYLIKGNNFTPRYNEDVTYPGMTWTSTTLPSGLFLTQEGTITGTTTQIGTFTPKFTASNPSGTSAPVPVSIGVLPQPPKVEIPGYPGSIFPIEPNNGVPPIVIDATQNQSITPLQINSVSKVPVTWTATNLPKGIVLSKSGLLSGRPTVNTVSKLITSTATVKNSGGSLSVSIIFKIIPVPVITSTVFTINEDSVFNFKIAATQSPISYNAQRILNGVEKPLPTWVVFNKNTGTFTGTSPLLSSGLYIFRVTVTTAPGPFGSAASASKDISVTVRPVELSLGAGTFTGLIYSVSGVAELRTIYSAVSVKLDQFIPGDGTFSPNLGKEGDNGETIFTLGARYYIQGNPLTNCPPGNGIIKHPGKMIYHAYKNTLGSSYKPGERKGILVAPGKTFRQLGFSQGMYNLIATWVPSRCARAVGWKVTYSYALQMWVN